MSRNMSRNDRDTHCSLLWRTGVAPRRVMKKGMAAVSDTGLIHFNRGSLIPTIREEGYLTLGGGFDAACGRRYWPWLPEQVLKLRWCKRCLSSRMFRQTQGRVAL